MVVVFSLTLALLLDHQRADRKYFAAFGLFGSVAVPSDPLSVYALGIAVLLILFKNIRSGFFAASAVGVWLAVYGFYLFASGSAYVFFQDVLLFNSQIYSKYQSVSMLRLSDLWINLVHGLWIANPAW